MAAIGALYVLNGIAILDLTVGVTREAWKLRLREEAVAA